MIDERPTWRQTSEAIFRGSVTSFVVTHNPIYHIIFVLAPFAILTGPYFGGIAARTKSRFGLLSALLAAAIIGLVTWAPVGGIVVMLAAMRGFFATQAQADQVIFWATAIWGGMTMYSVILCLIGIYVGERRSTASTTTASAPKLAA